MFNEAAIKYLYKHTKRAEGGLPQRLLDEVVEKCARFQVSFDNCCMKIGMLDDGNPFKQIRLSCIKGIEIVDNEIAVVMNASIIFLDNTDGSIKVSIKNDRKSVWRRFFDWLSPCRKRRAMASCP